MLQPNALDDSLWVSVRTSSVAVLQLEYNAEYRAPHREIETNGVVDLARVAERVQACRCNDARAS
eukprot:5232195-Pyramimonas_sp.AAC.1